MSRLTAVLKAVPLCCALLFVAAAEDDCTIRIITDDGDDDCEDVDEVCNLDCVLATNDEGCEICECVTDPPPPDTCQSDADCRDGQVCVASQIGCPPCANDPSQPCDIACPVEGTCVDINPDPCAVVLCSPDTFCAVDESGQAVCLPINGELCFSDSDCGARAFCDFSTCNGSSDGSDGSDGNEPAPPDDGDNDGGQDIACLGTCKEFEEPIGCENVLCQDGTVCVEGFNGPECVPVESQCNTDEDCSANGQGGRCEISCLPMPGCPECDACLIIGQCVNDPPAECTSDADCASGRCNAGEICLSDPSCEDPDGNGFVPCQAVCWGYCEEPQPTSCFEDADCADGEICEVIETCLPCDDPNGQNCLAPCYVEGRCVAANDDGNTPDQPPQP